MNRSSSASCILLCCALFLHLFVLCGSNTCGVADAADSLLSKGEKEEFSVSSNMDFKSLVFSTQCRLESGPISHDAHALRQFLERPEIRDLFMSAGGERSCKALPKNEHMRDLWNTAFDRHYGLEAPCTTYDDNNVDIRASETFIQFPGFRATNSVVCGCIRIPPLSSTFILPNNNIRLNERRSSTCTTLHNEQHQQQEQPFVGPVHRFYLIAERIRFGGPRALVRMIRQLAPATTASFENVVNEEDKEDKTGGYQSTKSFRPTATKVTTLISVVAHPSEGEEDNGHETERIKYGFQLEIDFSIQVEIPKKMEKFIPAAKSQIEELGARCVHKAVLADATMVLDGVQERWMKKYDQKSRHEA